MILLDVCHFSKVWLKICSWYAPHLIPPTLPHLDMWAVTKSSQQGDFGVSKLLYLITAIKTHNSLDKFHMKRFQLRETPASSLYPLLWIYSQNIWSGLLVPPLDVYLPIYMDSEHSLCLMKPMYSLSIYNTVPSSHVASKWKVTVPTYMFMWKFSKYLCIYSPVGSISLVFPSILLSYVARFVHGVGSLSFPWYFLEFKYVFYTPGRSNRFVTVWMHRDTQRQADY